MDKRLYLHLATAGLTGLVVGTIVLFWAYPKLLVYVLLAIVAALSYGALYLILAARLDPKKKTAEAPGGDAEAAEAGVVADAGAEVAADAGAEVTADAEAEAAVPKPRRKRKPSTKKKKRPTAPPAEE